MKILSIIVAGLLFSSTAFADVSGSNGKNDETSKSKSKNSSKSSSDSASETKSKSEEKSKDKSNAKSTSDSTTKTKSKEKSQSGSWSLSINPIPIVIEELRKSTPDDERWIVLGQKDLGISYSDVVGKKVLYIDTLKRSIYEDKAKSYEEVDDETFEQLKIYIPMLYKFGEVSSYAIKLTQATGPFGFSFKDTLRNNLAIALEKANSKKIGENIDIKRCKYQGDLNNFACETNYGAFQLKIQTDGTLPVLLFHSDPWFSASTMANQKVDLSVAMSTTLSESLANAIESSKSQTETNALKTAQTHMRDRGNSVESRKSAEAALSESYSKSSNFDVNSAVGRNAKGDEGTGIGSMMD